VRSEGRLERSESKSIMPRSYIPNNLRLFAHRSPVAGKLRLWDDATSVGALQLETEATNINRLEFFASKKNPHAPYLLGVMLCYTGSLNRGVKWFDEGAKLGDVRCLYGKGVVVRDGDKVEGDR